MVFVAKALLWALLFAFGACIFSFLGVVAWRLPRKISFVKGRSMCPACGHALAGRDLVPVLSFLFLRGKCRHCGARLSPRELLAELLGGCLAVLCWLEFGYTLKCLVCFALLCVLTVVAFVDIDTMEIPNGLVVAAAVVGVISYFAVPEITIPARLLGVLSASLPLLLIALLVRGAFGGGDIKLMAACGLFLGWKLNLVALFLAVVAGGAFGVWLLATRRKGRKDQFAFGPFLCLGVAVSALWGDALLRWYLGFFPA